MTYWATGQRGLDQNQVSAARAAVHSVLGSAVASKATDRFCVAVASAFDRPAIWETVNVGRSLRNPSSSLSSPAVPAIVSFTLDGHPTAEDLVAAGDRRRRVALLRSTAYRAMQPVSDEVERITGGLLRPGTFLPHDPEPTVLVTQLCWLNRTMRTYGAPHALTEVGADPAVGRIDLPGRLVQDSAVDTAELIGAVTYSATNGARGAGVSVAVIDGEVAAGHPALAGRVIHRRNFTKEGWGNPSSHGTAVAGLVGADDAVHAGMAPEVELVNYKVLTPFTTDQDFDGYLGIQEALNDDVDVANCSWGVELSSDGSSRESLATDNAWRAGMVVVKSAGNRGPGPGTTTTPADASGVIVVGATNVAGTAVESYSSRGPVRDRPGPHLVAPGGDEKKPLTVAQVAGGFAAPPSACGTSFAAPHVAGLVALLRQGEPDLDPDGIRDRLVNSCRLLPGFGPESQGAGFVRLV